MTKILLREPYASRYLRWESRRIEQMGFVNNLLIGLASVLFFWLCEGAIDGKICFPFWSFITIVSTGICLFVSLVCGLFLACNRLKDFRETTKVIQKENQQAFYKKRNLVEDAVSTSHEIDTSKKNIEKFGTCTWHLLIAQLWTFGGGFLLLGVGVILKVFGC